MEFSGNLRRHQNTSTASKGFSPQNSAKGPRPKQAILFIHSTNIPPKNSSNQPMSAMNKRNVPNKNHPAYFTHMLLFFKRNKKKNYHQISKKKIFTKHNSPTKKQKISAFRNSPSATCPKAPQLQQGVTQWCQLCMPRRESPKTPLVCFMQLEIRPAGNNNNNKSWDWSICSLNSKS